MKKKILCNFWELIRNSGAAVGITCNNLEAARTTVKELPNAEIHYDGEVNLEILEALYGLTRQLTVWLPYQTKLTNWVKIPYATKEICGLVKKYANLGIWIIDRYEDFDKICRHFQPDIVETQGQIKPKRNSGFIVDMHTHSEHSHDSNCPISHMASWQQTRGMYGFAVTDHCDVLTCNTSNDASNIKASVEQVQAMRRITKNNMLHIFSGIEIGEGICRPQMAGQILQMCDYDTVIASVHIVKYKQYDIPYSKIDFSAITQEEIYGYLSQYYDDVLQTLHSIPCDIAAHLNCPLRYINGKYGRGVDCRRFQNKLESILLHMIQHGIALEINTSCMEENGTDWLEQEWILDIYKQMGGLLVTLGSDAHVCKNAARKFERAIALLKKYDFKNCFYYEKRHSIQCNL